MELLFFLLLEGIWRYVLVQETPSEDVTQETHLPCEFPTAKLRLTCLSIQLQQQLGHYPSSVLRAGFLYVNICKNMYLSIAVSKCMCICTGLFYGKYTYYVFAHQYVHK